MTFSIRFNLLLGFVISYHLPYSFVLAKSSGSEQSPTTHSKEEIEERIEDLVKDYKDITEDIEKDKKEKADAEAAGDTGKANEFGESAAQSQEEADSMAAECG